MEWKNEIAIHMPPIIKPLIRSIYYIDLPLRNRLIPSKRLAALYGSDEGEDFRRTGDALISTLIKHAGLSNTSRVLDVGCGTGLLAVPLTSILSKGSYEGFDTISPGIKWCKSHITKKYPNFHFSLFDIYHESYNPTGKIQASDFRFPYDDSSFDIVILRSIFTHFKPEELRHYVSEINRVTKPGGRSFITFHLVNPETADLMENGKSYFHFEYKVEHGCYTTNLNRKSEYAYEESYIRMIYNDYDLKVQEPILYGGWRNGTNIKEPNFQDIVVAYKSEPHA